MWLGQREGGGEAVSCDESCDQRVLLGGLGFFSEEHGRHHGVLSRGMI